MTSRDELAKVIDDADNKWQHGVGNSGSEWKDFVADAVVEHLSPGTELELDVPEYDYVKKTRLRCRLGIHKWSIWTWPAGYRVCFICDKRDDR